MKSLTLIAGTKINNFEYSVKNCNIERFNINGPIFVAREAAQNFIDFMKMQKKIDALWFHASGLPSNRLAEMFSGESLKDIRIRDDHGFEELTATEMQNTSLEKLLLEDLPIGIDHRLLLRSFPNLAHLTLNYQGKDLFDTDGDTAIDLTVLNTLNLRYFSTSFITNHALGQLNLTQLKGLKMVNHLFECYEEHGVFFVPQDYINFLHRHQQLELFHHVSGHFNRYWSPHWCEYLQAVLDNLPLLKNLKFELFFEKGYEQDAIGIIKEAHERVDDLALIVQFEDQERAKEILEQQIPELKFTVTGDNAENFVFVKKTGKNQMIEDPVRFRLCHNYSVPLVLVNPFFCFRRVENVEHN